jgi:hypothetical protein
LVHKALSAIKKVAVHSDLKIALAAEIARVLQGLSGKEVLLATETARTHVPVFLMGREDLIQGQQGKDVEKKSIFHGL